MIRIIVFGGLYRGPLIMGNYHISFPRQGSGKQKVTIVQTVPRPSKAGYMKGYGSRSPLHTPKY